MSTDDNRIEISATRLMSLEEGVQFPGGQATLSSMRWLWRMQQLLCKWIRRELKIHRDNLTHWSKVGRTKMFTERQFPLSVPERRRILPWVGNVSREGMSHAK